MSMSTPSRSTYAQWLDALAETGRADDYGMVASAWLAARDHGRPRLSAVKSVNGWLSEHPPPGVANLQATLHRLRQAYGSGNMPPDPGAAQQPLFQAVGQTPQFRETVAQAGRDLRGETPYQPPAEPDPAWLPAEYHQQPAPPAEQPYPDVSGAGVPYPPAEAYETGSVPGQPAALASAGQPWQQQAPPEHPWQVVMLKLGQIEANLAELASDTARDFGRVEATLAAMADGLAPLVQVAAESAAADEALAASQLAQPGEAQQQALAIAREQGWTSGPAFTDDGPQMPPGGPQEPAAAPPDFYGGHVVPPPDFARMAAASEPEPEWNAGWPPQSSDDMGA